MAPPQVLGRILHHPPCRCHGVMPRGRGQEVVAGEMEVGAQIGEAPRDHAGDVVVPAGPLARGGDLVGIQQDVATRGVLPDDQCVGKTGCAGPVVPQIPRLGPDGLMVVFGGFSVHGVQQDGVHVAHPGDPVARQERGNGDVVRDVHDPVGEGQQAPVEGWEPHTQPRFGCLEHLCRGWRIQRPPRGRLVPAAGPGALHPVQQEAIVCHGQPR